MPRRIDFDVVKKTFKESGYTLLETTYKNNKTQMKYICPKHPKVMQETTYQVLKKCVKTCAFCCNLMNYIDDIKEEFESRGYKLLEETYINNKNKMRFVCSKHDFEIQKITYNMFSRGQGCKYCSREQESEKKRIPLEVVKKEFEQHGYELIDDYINGEEPLRFICPKHRDKETYLRYRDLRKGVRCRYCHIDNNKGEKHFAWKGGTRQLNLYLRDKMTDWRKESYSDFNYKCVIAGTNKDLVIHHVKPFHKLRDEMLEELKIPVYKTVGEYTQKQLDLMVENLKAKHADTMGVPIERDIHTLFHKIYGYETNKEDLIEFKMEYLNGEKAGYD